MASVMSTRTGDGSAVSALAAGSRGNVGRRASRVRRSTPTFSPSRSCLTLGVGLGRSSPPRRRNVRGRCPTTDLGAAEMAERTCSIEGCDRPAKTLGWCGTHYERWRKHGDVNAGRRKPVIERFWDNVDRPATPDACWLWTGRLDKDGYGVISVGRRPVRAHRFAYELLVGPISAETLDHDCHTRDRSCPGGACFHRRCMNPAHLRPVTAAENARLVNGRKTHCKNGHELTPDNLRKRKPGTGHDGRECLTCHRAWRKRPDERK